MRAAPAPTPSFEPSPPTEMSTGGRIWEHVARACRTSSLLQHRVYQYVMNDDVITVTASGTCGA